MQIIYSFILESNIDPSRDDQLLLDLLNSIALSWNGRFDNTAITTSPLGTVIEGYTTYTDHYPDDQKHYKVYVKPFDESLNLYFLALGD